MIKKIFGLGTIVMMLALSCVLGSKAVYADIPESSPIFQKIVYAGAVDCYKEDSDNGGMVNEISLGDFNGTEESLRKRVKTSGMDYTDGSPMDDHAVKWLGYKEKECGELLTNYTAKRFVASPSAAPTLADRAKILESMNYTKISSGEVTDKKCHSFSYVYANRSNKNDPFSIINDYTDNVCVEGSVGNWQISVESNDAKASNTVGFSGVGKNKITVKVYEYGFLGASWPHSEPLTFDGASSAADVLAKIGNSIAALMGSSEDNTTKISANGGYAYALCGNFVPKSDGSGIECPNNTSQNYTFPKTKESDNVYGKISLETDSNKNKLVNNLSGGKYNYTTPFPITFTPMQRYDLYQYYLTDIYGASSLNCYENPQGGAGVGPIRLWWSAQNKYSDYCYAVIEESKQSIKVNGVYNNGYFGLELTLQDMINQLNKLTLKSKPDSVIGSNDDPDKEDVNDASSPYDKCYEAGLDSQAWVICPTIRNMTESIAGMDGLVNSWLSIRTNDFQASGNTEGVWGVFRNIANVVMIIILLAIIFSQLTGYGIDNYGIKKMLPKLVLMAVLINLSFIICELAVDLSNIIGNGLYNLLRNLGEVGYTGDSASYSLADTVTKLLGMAAAAGSAAGVGMEVIGFALSGGGGGVMIILSLLLVLLAALIAVFMFFVMLGGRLVIVIFFTMVSPLAFACYILPNTQGLFKKWWNIFKTALVIYPICGALYGLSYLIRGSLVGATDNFPMMLVAAISPFLPFLALPILLKGAMSALGVVGGALTSLGNGLRSGISKGNSAVRDTGMFKNAQEQQRRGLNRWRAGVTKDKDGNYKSKDVNAVGKFLRGGRSGMASARAQLLRDENTVQREKSFMSDTGFAAAVIGQQKAAEADEMKDYMTLINKKTNNGADEAELWKIFNEYKEARNKPGALAAARIAGRRKDTAARFLASQITGTGYDRNTEEGRKAYESMVKSNMNNADILGSVAKEIAEGENSKNFKEASPFGFDFMSQYNQTYSPAEGKSSIGTDYASWLTPADLDTSNADSAANRYITKSTELVGAQRKSLEELANLMATNKIGANEKERLVRLARDTIQNKDTTGVWDTTKEQEIYRIANGGIDPGMTVPHNNPNTPPEAPEGYSRFGGMFG